MSVEIRVEVLESDEAAAARAASFWAEKSRGSVATRGGFSSALSGGRTPWRMFELLGNHDIPWDAVDLYQADERIAPRGHPDRSMTHLETSLPAAARARLHPMPVETAEPAVAAAAYAKRLPSALDLIHLGLGPDGHTASLVPGDPVLDVTDRAVAISGPYQSRMRMTLTFPVLDGGREILWLVTGDDKPEALRKLVARDASIPASRVRAPVQVVFADRAAASALG